MKLPIYFSFCPEKVLFRSGGLPSRLRIFIFWSLVVSIMTAWPSTGSAANNPIRIPTIVDDNLSKGKSQDLIVLFDDSEIEAEAATLRQRKRISHDDDSIMTVRRTRYRSLKQGAVTGLPFQEMEELRDYDHLPMSYLRFNNRAALDRLLADPGVKAVYENRPVYPHLAYSLPFIGQPAVAAAGLAGSGTTVAVIDTGINYTLSAFGFCTDPGVPAGCRVAASVDVTGNNVTLNSDPNGHGTNVAGIVAGVASASRIAAINVFFNGSGSTDWVIAGINWAIANKGAYNISALNMSLGDDSKNSALCGNIRTNPFVTPINNLRAAGIIPVASTGNNAYSDGISNPACTPGVVSVGAVYDANWGGHTWTTSGCTDSTSGADRIPCFSNSASFMTILAPGAFITAAGVQFGGTSQAAPHVAGAATVLRAAYPGELLDQTIARMTSSGVSVTDSRNGITKPRLNLSAAIGVPANNMFANRTLLSGNSGNVTANNLNATKEPGEPLHAGNSGGKSVWWSWTPSVSGVASFDTHGSKFDTLLAVYSGNTLAGLSQIAANDNDGSSGNCSGLAFTAQSGTEYLIAIDGYNGASGGLSLNWSLTQQADLGITLSQFPVYPLEGDALTYTVTVTNNGPSAASGVVVTDNLPTGVSFVSASTGCSVSGSTVTCNLGTLANNTSSTVQIHVTALAAGNLTNSAQVSSSISDPLVTNNSTSATTKVNQAEAVPALSPWALLIAGAFLAAGAGRRTARSNA